MIIKLNFYDCLNYLSRMIYRRLLSLMSMSWNQDKPFCIFAHLTAMCSVVSFMFYIIFPLSVVDSHLHLNHKVYVITQQRSSDDTIKIPVNINTIQNIITSWWRLMLTIMLTPEVLLYWKNKRKNKRKPPHKKKKKNTHWWAMNICFYFCKAYIKAMGCVRALFLFLQAILQYFARENII
jgi:hypothetical protein